LLKNTLFMLASNALRLLTGVVLLLLLARFWGAETFGKFMYPFTLAGLTVILVDYGFNLQVVRDIGKDPGHVHYITCKALTIKLYLTIGMLLVGGIIFWIFPLLGEYRMTFCLLWIANVFNSFGVLFNLAFRGLELFNKEVVITFYSNVITFILIGILVWVGYGPVGIAVGFVLAKAFFMAISWYQYSFVVAEDKFKCSKWSVVISSLSQGFPFAIHVALGTLYFQVDTIIIEHFLGAKSVGIYQSALRVMIAGLIMTDVISNVYLPRMAKSLYETESLTTLGTCMTRYCLCIGVIGLVVMSSGGDWIVDILYGGGEYKRVATLFPLFGVVLLLRYLGASYGIILTASNRQTVRMVAVSLSFVVSIGLNFWLVPKMGLVGALFASIVTHIFLTIVYILFAWKQTGSWLIDIRSIILLGIALTALYSSNFLSPVFVLIVSVVSVALVGVTKTDWNQILKFQIRRTPVAGI